MLDNPAIAGCMGSSPEPPSSSCSVWQSKWHQMAKLDFGSSRRPGLEVVLVRSELKDQVETSHEVLGAARVEKLASDLPHKPKQAVSGGQSYVAGQSGREQ